MSHWIPDTGKEFSAICRPTFLARKMSANSNAFEHLVGGRQHAIIGQRFNTSPRANFVGSTRTSAESTAREVHPIAILKMEVQDFIEFVNFSLSNLKQNPGDELAHATLNPYQKWEIASEGDLMGITLREIVEPVTAALEQVCRRLVAAKNLPDGSSVQHPSQDITWDINGVNDYDCELK